jgi:hypothetical protein
MEGWKDEGCMEGRIEERMEGGWMYGRTQGWRDGGEK